MNKETKAIRKKLLSVKFYRNLRRNLFYGINFNQFHTIIIIIIIILLFQLRAPEEAESYI
jgi:hypothetical protein